MCDPFTAASSVMTNMGARAQASQSNDIIDRADFEAAQIDAMVVMAGVKAQGQEAEIREQLGNMYKTNQAAAVLSGVDAASFDHINAAQAAEGSKAIGKVYANADAEKANLRRTKNISLANAKVDAATNAANAYLGALQTNIQTGMTALNTYRDYKITKTGQDPMDRISANMKSAPKKVKSFFKLFWE